MNTKLPMVFNEYPGRLIQLTMCGSVGRNGQNRRDDVLTVQRLLNLADRGMGGPPVPLAADGIAGPKTIAAITAYQTANRLFNDGRMDAYGPTVMHLMRRLNAASRVAVGIAPGIGRPKPEVERALSGGVAVRGVQEKFDLNTGWDMVSSSGMDVSISIVGVAIVNIYAKHDIEPTLKKPYIITFAGAGVGLSMLPVGLDFSFADMPSWGTRIVRCHPLARKAPFNVNEYVGQATIVLSVGANVGPGWSGTAVLMGGKYACAMTGMQAGIPGGSISAYIGAIAGWS